MTETKSNSMRNPSFWQFKAKLSDGRILTDLFEINRNREQVKLIGLFYGNEHRATVELLDPTQRLILVRRTQQDYDEVSLKLVARRIVFLVGWQSTVEGRNVKTILHLYEDGSVTLKNNDGRSD